MIHGVMLRATYRRALPAIATTLLACTTPRPPGSQGQPCEDDAAVCDPGLACFDGLCEPTPCGRGTEPCCYDSAGGTCDDGLICVGGVCGACGNAGEPCCYGGCSGGLACGGTGHDAGYVCAP